MVAKMKKRFKITTKSNPKEKPAPNLLNQSFVAEEPNQRWVADFTYVYTKEGWLYVAGCYGLIFTSHCRAYNERSHER